IPVLQEIIEQETSTETRRFVDTKKNPFSPAELATLKQTYQALLSDAEQLSDLKADESETAHKHPVKTNPEQILEASQAAATPETYTPPQARGENPFLPQHIRARLR